MTTLILGSSGMLGSALMEAIPDAVGLTHEQIDICDPSALQETMDLLEPELVINCAAYHNVDEAESRPLHAMKVNAIGARNVAHYCGIHDARLIHISTSYVFDGIRGRYAEFDIPKPLSVYGMSKLLGEYLVADTLDSHYIVRTTALFGPNGQHNFVDRMRDLAMTHHALIVNDQFINPTYAPDLAKAIAELPGNSYGTYHITNSGDCSWYEFAKRFLIGGCAPITTEAFDAKAERPRDARLENTKLDPLRPWEEALGEYLNGG